MSLRIKAKKHCIELPTGLDDLEAGLGEAISSYESTDYGQKKHGFENLATSYVFMELDRMDVP